MDALGQPGADLAAVNEAGRMRMQSHWMALSIGTSETAALPDQLKEFNQSLATLRSAYPERPLFVPWDDTVHARFDIVEQDWAHFRARWLNSNPSVLHDLL
jgi:two-component system nitrate/nitrite sensor histidine kinase NarX